MSGHFPTISSLLSPTALEESILSKYSLPSPVECRLFGANCNHVYKVRCGAESVYLRITPHGWRTRPHIESEIQLLNELHSRGLSVAVPIRARDGSYFQVIDAPEGERYAVLFTNAEGGIYDILNSGQNIRCGEMTGTLHSLCDQLKTPLQRYHMDRQHLLDEPLSTISRFIPHRKADIDYLKYLVESFKMKLKPLPRTTPQYGICHGDLHSQNIYFDDRLNPTLFDFDCFSYSWRAYDIGAYIYYVIFSPRLKSNRMKSYEILNEFLTGYGKIRELSDDEVYAINFFIVIQQLWSLGLSIDLARYKGFRQINDSYFDNNIDIIKQLIRDLKIL
jgi:Ser/Thr protein kinase RdoA (MazF antagonist)